MLLLSVGEYRNWELKQTNNWGSAAYTRQPLLFGAFGLPRGRRTVAIVIVGVVSACGRVDNRTEQLRLFKRLQTALQWSPFGRSFSRYQEEYRPPTAPKRWYPPEAAPGENQL